MFSIDVMTGVWLPFVGTALGAVCVFFIRKEVKQGIQRVLTGFAAGVMIAASIWSLILPSLEAAEGMGGLAFVPAVAGFWIGIIFLWFLDVIIPHMHVNARREGPRSRLGKTTMLVFAVTIHNVPEGMAVGAVYAGWLSGNAGITLAGAFTLALGIAIQNLPEGAIVSMPMKTRGVSKGKAFTCGILSGVVEPIAAIITIALADILVPILPYMLSFAAGAMIYVVVDELIPEMSEGNHSNMGTISFAIGFSIMMLLDVMLG